jgi:hypothetical protein
MIGSSELAVAGAAVPLNVNMTDGEIGCIRMSFSGGIFDFRPNLGLPGSGPSPIVDMD